MENKNYFTHDYRSRLDTKLLEVRMKHGMEGFGVYWGLVEMLHEGNGTIQMKPDVIAYEFRCNVELVKDIVSICFERTEDDLITCNRVMENLRIRKEKFESKSEKGRDAANKRWGKDRSPMGDVWVDDGFGMGNHAKEKEKEKEKEKVKEIDLKIDSISDLTSTPTPSFAELFYQGVSAVDYIKNK
jgi:hypothetical protein